MELHKNVGFIVLVFGVVLVGGVFFFHHFENWSYLDSAYFVSVTVTTIGYGDFVPVTSGGKIFTVIYSFIGVAVVLYLLSAISSNIFKRHLTKHANLVKAKVDLKRRKRK